MEKFLNALERKFGRYAVPDLIKYVVIIYCAGAVIGLVNPYFYYQYLSLNMNAVFHGDYLPFCWNRQAFHQVAVWEDF